jgi:hypothetical protein
MKMAFKIMFSSSYTESLLSQAQAPLPQLTAANTDGALQLLALMQAEGRLIDFIQEDVSAFDDAQIGAAARVVHQGVKKALLSHIELSPITEDMEGTTVTLPADFNAHAYRLVGNISGQGPYNGTLVHKGWRATSIELPQTVEEYDFTVLAPAEVEV